MRFPDNPFRLTGQQLKEQALDNHEDTKSQYIQHARSFARQHSKEQGQVCINDIRKSVPVPEDMHPSVMGAVFRGEMWEAIGYTTAEHPGAHRRVIKIYKWNGS
jgi:hypothetical protein